MHVIGTAGHVDHGKSRLVQALTGTDPDRFEEEKRRGLTIDLGFAWLELPSGNEIGIVDVPGHERFIRNMLAGAGGVSVCLFVVAANEGWMRQSAEHLAILDILGVDSGVVALTKSDTVSGEELESARAEVVDRIAGSSLEGAPVVPCSAVTGDGLDSLISALDAAVSAAPEPVDAGRPRLWVDRVFTIAGAGTVVTGTLAGGSFATGDEVEIAPDGRRARIRKIQSHKKEVASIGPGNRVALNLAGLERQGAERGDAIVTGGRWRPTSVVDVSLRVVEHELSDKGAHSLHVGSAETPVRVKLLDSDALQVGELGSAELYLRDALPLARGDRFVLRDSGRVITVGGGVVLDPAPSSPARRGDLDRIRLLGALAHASSDDALAATVESEGRVALADALFRSGSAEVPGAAHILGGWVYSEARLEDARRALNDALEAHHREQPLRKGMDREAARAAVAMDGDEFDDLVRATDGVVEDGKIVRRAEHGVQLDPEQEAARVALLGRLEDAGFSPPLAKDLGADEALVRALVESGELVKVGDFYLTADVAASARRKVREAIENSGPKTVAEIRDLLGTSRKYAVPLCEWLDSWGATARRGDVRLLGPNP